MSRAPINVTSTLCEDGSRHAHGLTGKIRRFRARDIVARHRGTKMRSIIARAIRGMRKTRQHVASHLRKAALRAQYPGLEFKGRVFIAPGCAIHVGHQASMTIQSCHVSRSVTLTAGPNSRMAINADYIGPNSTIVSRESVVIGSGSKLAENVVVRDANHDHSVPLAMMTFTNAPIVIGSDAWLGASSIILAGVTVGHHATVAAGAVVTHDVAEGGVVGGVPARSLTTSVEK